METITVTKEQKALIDDLCTQDAQTAYNSYLCDAFGVCTNTMAGIGQTDREICGVMNMLEFLHRIIKTFGQTTKA